ncbi:hypothetical protein [Streptomyces sp. NBC_00203]|uniref:hypothetical protein n=1 Tax=Streptomyces sp. NBC_00203 TaxID=2975680 RepID=UPI00324996BE
MHVGGAHTADLGGAVADLDPDAGIFVPVDDGVDAGAESQPDAGAAAAAEHHDEELVEVKAEFCAVGGFGSLPFELFEEGAGETGRGAYSDLPGGRPVGVDAEA